MQRVSQSRIRGAFGFGIARSIDGPAARARLTELCEVLTKAMGVVFFAHLAVHYRELVEAIDRGMLGFAWMPPIPAIELEERGAAKTIALPVRRGSASYHAAVITRRGGPRSLAELRGARVAWVDRDSSSGYLVARMHLATQGVDVERGFAQEQFLHSHEAVVDAVLDGRVDAGATFCSLDPRSGRVVQAAWTAPDGSAARPIDVLTTAGPIPNDGIVAASAVIDDVRARMTRWLLDPDTARGKELLGELLRADAFRAASPMHYAPLKRILTAARATPARGTE